MSVRVAVFRSSSVVKTPLSKSVCSRVPSSLATEQLARASSTACAPSLLQNKNLKSVREEKSTWASRRNTSALTQQLRRLSATTEAKTKSDKNHIVSAAANDKRQWVEVMWSDYLGRYPYVWLRDNCRCDECYYPSCHSRSMLMANLDLDVHPKTVEVKEDGHLVQILWSDGHTSPYPSDWLKLQRFDKTDYDSTKKLSKISWGAEFINEIPTFSFDDVMSKNSTLHEWMESLVVYGLVKVTGAPLELGVLQKLCRKVAFERLTCYGHDFRVESLFNASSLAYTAKALGLHVDLPFYGYRPGVQLLHCIKQVESKGGESQFGDGKRAAEQLRHEHPELYDIMTKVKIDFRLIATDYTDVHLQEAQTMIELDENGEFKALAKNDQVRAPYLNVPVEDVAKVYKAMKLLHDAIYDKENLLDFKLQKGEIMAFDNNRVLHGRSGYEVSMEGEAESRSRLLEGAFLDWDEIYSRMRLIDEELRGSVRL